MATALASGRAGLFLNDIIPETFWGKVAMVGATLLVALILCPDPPSGTVTAANAATDEPTTFASLEEAYKWRAGHLFQQLRSTSQKLGRAQAHNLFLTEDLAVEKGNTLALRAKVVRIQAIARTRRSEMKTLQDQLTGAGNDKGALDARVDRLRALLKTSWAEKELLEGKLAAKESANDALEARAARLEKDLAAARGIAAGSGEGVAPGESNGSNDWIIIKKKADLA